MRVLGAREHMELAVHVPTQGVLGEHTLDRELQRTFRVLLEEFAERYPFRYSKDELPNLSRALVRHYPSHEVELWVKQFVNVSGRTSTMGLLRAITLAVRQDFAYTRRQEKGVQNPILTLETRTGSCRDFAVLMMEAVRSLGLAARFVSGYIFIPGKDAPTLTGGGATHAWMQVYLPGAGWIDFDPTNSIIGNRNLIRVAVAWSHEQVLPLWGTFSGASSWFVGMDVTVSVTETAAGTPQPASGRDTREEAIVKTGYNGY